MKPHSIHRRPGASTFPSQPPASRTHACAIAMLALAAAFLAGCGKDSGSPAARLFAPNTVADPGAPDGVRSQFEAADFDPEDFVRVVDHPFFPLTPGSVYSYVGETENGTETIEVEVLHDRKTILGVATTVVRDRVYLEGELVEDTFDWYAQDEDGNVWYLGEDVKNYENGVLVDTHGSWEAGVNGATAGIMMLAEPKVGDAYQQEHAAGVAEDMAKVRSLSETTSVPYGTFRRCIQVLEWTPLEPGKRGFKYYARGVGQVLESSTRGGRDRVELVSVSGR